MFGGRPVTIALATRYFCLPLLVCQSMVSTSQLSHAGPPAIVMAAISLETSFVTQHEPVLLELALNNQSEQEIVVSLGDNDEKINIKVIDPDGRIFLKPRSIRQGFAASDAVYVAAGRTAVRSVALTDWFNFDEIGTYQIEVNLSSSSSAKERFSYTIQGNRTLLSLRILPYDEGSLVAACADLLNRIQDLHSHRGSAAAAKALSKINDAAAVPFLAAAMKENEFKSLMIDALARLKTQDAVEALVAATRSDDPETRNLAHAALAGIG